MSETILITGAAMRLGAALARGLAGAGHSIVLHYNTSHDAAEALASDIAHAGGKARTIGCDLTNPANYQMLIEKGSEAFGPLTVLINNASQFRPDEADRVSEADWNTHFMMHVEAPTQLAAFFSRQLPEGRVGNIINMIDERVLRVPSKFFSYTLSKAALWTATRTMALHYAPRIRVNAIGPGPSLPERGQSEDAFRAEQRRLPLERGPELDEFTAAALFFLGAPSVTGQMIALDGGRHLLGPEL
jgi:NAD(P)-dependent dehydrogenase (short-subunit alcohol dehydrogenase family)